jgi:hypothetical protein
MVRKYLLIGAWLALSCVGLFKTTAAQDLSLKKDAYGLGVHMGQYF